jgi:Icc-related predicted phosphoesterase
MMDELMDHRELADKIIVSHGPPFKTSTDLGYGGSHLGSNDLRSIIESEVPMAVLSGHIHEAPRRSGKMVEMLGDTWIANPGSKGWESSFMIGEFSDCLRLSGHVEKL